MRMDYSSYFDYDENLIPITKYEVLGKLPDPFLFENGERVNAPDDWERRKKEIYRTAVELQYGTQPPKPEVFYAEVSYRNKKTENIRITAGTKEKQVTFQMKLFLPEGAEGRLPVSVEGDLCFCYAFTPGYLDALLDRGIAVAVFDRTALADDIQFAGRRHGPLYDIYPEYTFGALGAWAWGYSRCVDALLQNDRIDPSCIAFTGHSRGAKTAMLAGVLDERAAIVNPNESNAASCSCYRVHMEGIREDGTKQRGEELSDLWHNFDFWIGEKMGEYVDREQDLPFDCHFLKSLIAPRVLLVGEAASDLWTNPIGSWQTSTAAAEVFRFLGAPENMLWYFRRGNHAHLPVDADMLAEVICRYRDKKTLADERFFRTPFIKPVPIWDFKAPIS